MRRALVLGAGALACAGAITAAAAGFGGETTAPPVVRQAVEPVLRQTLTRIEPVNGVLGYGPPIPVPGAGQGTITWLPATATVLRRGRAVFRADDRPVPLFYGSLPLYRTLRTGLSGRDVRLVERNLWALGYRGFTVDGRFTPATSAAVRVWQRKLHLPRTGVVEPSSVVVARGTVRVAVVSAHLGDPSSGPVLSYSGTTRVVTVALDVALQELAVRGSAAEITLPAGRIVRGRVTRVGRVASVAQQGGPATIAVTVAIRDQKALGRLDQAPVVVGLRGASAENVLTVPVTALLARPGGGYAVRVAGREVPVELGLFADGRVEVRGVTEGTLVGVPS
ncbi:peptidoglycan-binding protein [Sphaerisporangium aureirubrum]|uniref:Peptidoglycan-binding protein n=1 Tax=Sphaerisporangium aureirubrum TaxID=1544736 RepID=A0ABW1NM59_9ACTN